MAAALGLDVDVFRRVWVCDMDCNGFLRPFIWCPDFFVDYMDHGVERPISFKT